MPPAEAGSVTLTAIRFPKSITGDQGPQQAPSAAPLSQAVVFEFSGKPQIGSGIADGLRIRASTNGTLALGSYKVKGNQVIFRPRLPTIPLDSFGPGANVAAHSGFPGLLPGTQYQVSVTLDAANSVINLKKIAKDVIVPLTFTTALEPAEWFANAAPDPVHAKKKKIQPANGTKGLHPNPFSDPAGLFSKIGKPKRPPFRIPFDAPLSPDAANFAGGRFRLRAIKGPDGTPEDVVLGATPFLTRNTPGSAEVTVYPNGMLPLGHVVALELSNQLRSLNGVQAGGGGPEVFAELARFRIAADPAPGAALEDVLEEEFTDAARQDASIAAEGLQLASWGAGAGVLRASFGFGGDGSLGPFAPPPQSNDTVVLDTDFQAFPLFSGATPNAKPGTAVIGGVFHFTDFHLPPEMTLVARGSNPLVITATGNVLIEGNIDLNGGNGGSDQTFDSALTPMPGGSAGPGGGRGGNSHPVTVPPGAQGLHFIQSPQFGQSGFGPGNAPGGGAGGGQCGCTLPWFTITGNQSCASFAYPGDGSRGAGGGGGSFNVFFPQAPEDPGIPVSGRRGAIGVGNHLPIPFKPGNPIPTTAADAYGGDPTKNALARPNPNLTFAQAHQAGLIWDQAPTMNLSGSNPVFWPQTKRVLMFGNAGPGVFTDGDLTNDFIGPGGELAALRGGQGGGGGGSRTEGLDITCRAITFDVGQPFTTLDARGGGGGGGAGSMLLQALGTIEFRGPQARIEATGGHGGGGEGTSLSDRGGGGGSGSGGAVILQSGTNVLMNDPALPAVVIDVSGGCPANAIQLPAGGTGPGTTGTPGGEPKTLQFADGGPGGPGIVQIHVPAGAPPQVLEEKVSAQVFRSVFKVGNNGQVACQGTDVGLSTFNPLVDRAKTPTPLTSKSVARSTWYDLGAMTSAFRPPVVTTAGALAGPVFGVPGVGPFFRGTDPFTGLVETDAAGHILDPFGKDIEVDAPDLQQADYIPNGTEDPHVQSVAVFFQGADESALLPGSPDLASATAWSSDPTLVNGRRFVRWEVRFDIALDAEVTPTSTTPRPQVNRLRVPFQF